MERSARVEKIILEAPQWSFEGDCSLLSWMQELSMNLEQRATNTSQAIQQLSIDVNRAATSLDNAANSLTALQYTQFVESRVHDDDETMLNVADMATETIKIEEESKSPNEILKTFLSKNLEMLHNCHEKYAIDIEDSDEEEAANNCIYQPKNPYNEALLPHIYGSKLWKEHWHIGLCDGENEYSGDEMSEAFSESSTSAEDNESYESNTANLSEWASSTSIPIESKHPAQIAIQNNSSLGVSPTDLSYQKHVNPVVTRIHSADTAGSDSSSTTSRSATINAPHIREHDLFADLRDAPTTSSTSSISAAQHLPANSSSGSSATRYLTLPPLYDTTPPNDIFAEPTQSVADQGIPRTSTNQIKRKPVNLFDDDDFNSFMTEIVDKAQTKVEPPVPAARNLSTVVEKSTTVEKSPRRVLDLFDETVQNNFNEVVEPIQSKQTTQPSIQERKAPIRKPKLDLFGSPEGSPTDEGPLFQTPKIATKDDKTPTINEPITKTRLTTKNLFDDDDDDDFLNVFGAKKPTLHQTSGKTLLFDDDEMSIPAANDKLKNNFLDNNKLLRATETITNKTATENENNQILSFNSQQKQVEETHAIEADPTLGKQTKRNEIAKPVNKLQNNLFGANLFDDNDDDADDLFSKNKFTNDKDEKPKSEQTKSNLSRKSIFDSNFDNENDLFSDSPKGGTDTIEKTSGKSDKITTDVPKAVVQPKNNSTSDELHEITSEPPPLKDTHTKPKYKPLFSDDFDDEENYDLFSKMRTKQTANTTNEPFAAVPVEQNISNVSINTPIDNNDQLNLVTATVPILNEAKTAVITSPSKLPVLEDIPEDGGNDEKTDEFVEAKETEHIMNKSNVPQSPRQETPPKTAELRFENVEVNNGDTNVCSTSTKLEESVAEDITRESPNITTLKNIENEKLDDTPANPISISDTSEVEQLDSQQPALQQPTAATHNFSGIFLDEPPDDDDFFQTLNNNKKISASKLTLDLENDFYEPALPAPPNTQKESNKTEGPTNEYGGLRLFSEVPPDDDDDNNDNNDNFNAQRTNTYAEQPNNRLHSIFYDDFTETLEAVQQINENKKIPTHSLFDDEPPPDDEEFDVIGKFTKGNMGRNTDAVQDVEENQSIEKSEIVVESGASKITDDILQTVTPHQVSVDELDRKAMEPPAELEKSRNGTGKLQMPKININVQALLPGAGGRPNFKKPNEEHPKVTEATASNDKLFSESSQMQLNPDNIQNSTPASTSTAGTVSENVLSNICKNRVRAPAKRRPSTRKARQENYRQSLRAEQEVLSDNETITIPSNHISQTEQIIQRNIKSADTPKVRNENARLKETAKESALNTMQNIPNMRVEKTKNTPTLQTNISTSNIITNNAAADPITQFKRSILTTKPTAGLFDDLTADNDDLFGNINESSSTLVIPQIDRSTVPPKREINSKSFLDEPSDDSDDNFFKPSTANKTKAAPIKNTGAEIKPISNTNKNVNKLFGSDDDDDGADADFLTQLRKTNPTIAGGGAIKARGGTGNLFSDAESDEDDLFGGKIKNTKSATKQNSNNVKSLEKTAMLKTPTATSNSVKSKTLADNPLADLFDS